MLNIFNRLLSFSLCASPAPRDMQGGISVCGVQAELPTEVGKKRKQTRIWEVLRSAALPRAAYAEDENSLSDNDLSTLILKTLESTPSGLSPTALMGAVKNRDWKKISDILKRQLGQQEGKSYYSPKDGKFYLLEPENLKSEILGSSANIRNFPLYKQHRKDRMEL